MPSNNESPTSVPISSTDEIHLLAAIALARKARENGNTPFGALLVDANNEVVLEAESTVITELDCTGHAEMNLMRAASKNFDSEFLKHSTLYASAEPCAMCAGAIYWGNVRQIIYALSNENLHKISGVSTEYPTLTIPCREIFAQVGHQVRVSGPYLESQASIVHENFW